MWYASLGPQISKRISALEDSYSSVNYRFWDSPKLPPEWSWQWNILSIAGIRGTTVVSSRRERRRTKKHEAFSVISEDAYCKWWGFLKVWSFINMVFPIFSVAWIKVCIEKCWFWLRGVLKSDCLQHEPYHTICFAHIVFYCAFWSRMIPLSLWMSVFCFVIYSICEILVHRNVCVIIFHSAFDALACTRIFTFHCKS